MKKYPLVSRFDPKYRFDPDEVWIKLVNLFNKSVQNKDVINIKNSLNHFEHYINVMDAYFDISDESLTESSLHSKKLNEMILSALFDFALATPIIDIGLQSSAAVLFMCLSKSEVFKSNISLSLEKSLEFYDEIFNNSRYLIKKIATSQVEKYLEFFSYASNYFDESASDKLLDKYLDKIGLSSASSTRHFYTLLRFYPATIASFDKIIPYLIPFIENPISPNITSSIMRYLTKTYKLFRYNKFYDWKPYIRSIFNLISNNFINTESIIGRNFSINKMKYITNILQGYGYDRGSLYVNASYFLAFLLFEYDEEKNDKITVSMVVLDSLKIFVNTFIHMINPKSEKAREAVKFVTRFTSNFYYTIFYHKKLHSEKVEYIKNIKIRDETVKNFVAIVLPFIETSLFNAPHSLREQALKIVPKLAELNYEKTVGELLPFCMKNMVDSELTSMAKICFKVVKVLIPQLLNTKHIDENLTKIPSIIDASLEFCKNSLLANYYLGMSVLSEIAQFVYVPDEKTLTSQFSMKKRMVANAMINSLQIVLHCHFEHNKPLTADYADNPYNNMLTGSSPDSVDTPVNTKNSDKGPLEKRFICYFTAFDDSYIESIVIPNVLKNLKNCSDATHLNSFTYKFTKYLTKAKPDLISRLLSPKLEEMFVKSNLKRKFFWAHLLASSFVSCPTFSEKIPHYVDLIQKLLNVNDIIDKKKEDDKNDDNEVQCYLKCAHVLCGELLGKMPGPNIIDWSNTEDGDDKLIWGKLYYRRDVQPKWYEIDQNIVNSSADSIFQSIQPLLEKFPDLEFKIQKKVIKIIFSFISLLSMRSKPGTIDFYDYEDNPTLFSIEKSLFEWMNKMLSKLQSYQSQKLILMLIDRSFHDQNRIYSKMVQTCFSLSGSSYHFILNENYDYQETRFYSLFQYFCDISSSLYKYMYEIKPYAKIITENIYKLTESEYSQISSFSSNLLETVIFQKKEIFNDYFQQKISVLENPNKTKEQFISAVSFICKSYPFDLLSDQNNVIKLIRTLISAKFEKEWNIDIYLKSVFVFIELLGTVSEIEDSENWRNLKKEIVSIQRTIDDSYFIIILRFIISQKNLPSTEIVQFLVNSLTKGSGKLNAESIRCLSFIFRKIRPIPQKAEFKTIDEFQKKYPSIVPYVDKLATGFYCKPHHYVFCTGDSVFDHEKTEEEEMRNFLIEKVFNNEKIFSDLFQTFILMHPKEVKPSFNNIIFKFWKRTCQILRMDFVKHTKSLILKMIGLIDSKSEEVQPVHLACLAELIAAISRASKHWSQNDRKIVIDEILTPSLTTLITQKGFNSVISDMAISIVLNWDYRRNLWLYEIVEEQYKKLHENLNENVLKNLLSFSLFIYRNAGLIFNKEYLRVMNNLVIPIFSDLKKFKIEDIALFAKLLSCKIAFTKCYRQEKEVDEESYQIASLPFINVFDKQKEEAPERVALILFHLLSQNFVYLSSTIQFITDRFKDICIIDSKLPEINSGKFVHIGKEIIMNTGLFYYQNFGEKLNEFLFDGIIKGQFVAVQNSLPWTSKLNLVGFLHALTLSHLFVFSKNQFLFIFNEILPPFLQDSNQEVRKAARSLIKVFIGVVFSDSKELCIEKVNDFLQMAVKEKGKSKKNLFTAVEFASALLANVSIWFSGCPDWLPNIFYSLEKIYKKGDCKEEIKEALNDFFTRHEGREINEIEEYKYVLTGGYLA